MMFLFFVGLAFLLLFSGIDLKTHKLDNAWITLFWGIGAYILLHSGESLAPMGVSMLILGIAGWGMWKFKMIGGADMKLLPAIAPFLPIIGIPNALGVSLKFIFILAILAVFYGLLLRKMGVKKKSKIAFIPIITIAYIATWIFRIY